MESLDHSENAFVTLTYRDDVCPETLNYKDFSNFLKRLRKSLTGKKIRFFACGEYGTKSGRAHWHALIFGHQFPELGLCRIAQWPQGFAYIGQVTPESINYTARYVLKGGPRGDECLFGSSRKPGVGFDSLRQLGRNIAQHNMSFDADTRHLMIGGKYFPLDKFCREAIASGVSEAGGVVQHANKSPTATGLAAASSLRLEQLLGDPVARSANVQRSFRNWSARQTTELSREKI